MHDVSQQVGTPGSNKPVIFIEGLAHAREWIVTASLIYTIDTVRLVVVVVVVAFHG